MQELVKLRYQIGNKPCDIAASLGRTVNSVSVALAKARASLRECIEQRLRREDRS